MRPKKKQTGHPAKVIFGTCIRQMLYAHDEPWKPIAEHLGIERNRLNIWMRGRWETIPEDLLLGVLQHVGRTPEERTDLLMAYVTDLIPMSVRGVVGVASKLPRAEVPDRLSMIERAAAMDPAVNATLESLHEWARRVTARGPQETQVKLTTRKRAGRKSKRAPDAP
jgi:hypothetical protein